MESNVTTRSGQVRRIASDTDSRSASAFASYSSPSGKSHTSWPSTPIASPNRRSSASRRRASSARSPAKCRGTPRVPFVAVTVWTAQPRFTASVRTAATRISSSGWAKTPSTERLCVSSTKDEMRRAPDSPNTLCQSVNRFASARPRGSIRPVRFGGGLARRWVVGIVESLESRQSKEVSNVSVLRGVELQRAAVLLCPRVSRDDHSPSRRVHVLHISEVDANLSPAFDNLLLQAIEFFQLRITDEHRRQLDHVHLDACSSIHVVP